MLGYVILNVGESRGLAEHDLLYYFSELVSAFELMTVGRIKIRPFKFHMLNSCSALRKTMTVHFFEKPDAATWTEISGSQ